MPYLDRDGVQVYYELHGPAPETVLLSHGFSATSQMWKPNLAALSARRQLVTWDIRGHGQTDSPEDANLYTPALSVGDMAALLDTVGADVAVIGGLSLGGYLSLEFYLAHPQRVRALMLFDTGPGYRKDEPRRAWNDMALGWAGAYERTGLDALGQGAEVRASQHRSAAGLAHAARGILTQSDSRVLDSLSEIKVPTLVLVGREDKPFLAAADVMAARIPGSIKVVLDGAGHAANLDQPEAFDKAVEEFLDSL